MIFYAFVLKVKAFFRIAITFLTSYKKFNIFTSTQDKNTQLFANNDRDNMV